MTFVTEYLPNYISLYTIVNNEIWKQVIAADETTPWLEGFSFLIR